MHVEDRLGTHVTGQRDGTPIAATFPTTIAALRSRRSPSSASAMARAEAVRFSIRGWRRTAPGD